MSEPGTDPTDAASEPAAQAGTAQGRATPRVTWVRAALAGLLLILALVVGTAFVLRVGEADPTARAHALLEPRLASIDEGIDQLVAQGALLAQAGRDVLTHARDLDPAGVDAAITAGTQASAAISGLREDLIKRRETLMTGVDPSFVESDQSSVGASDRARIESIDRALIGATQLPVSWVAIIASVGDPMDLVRSVRAHDARVAEAVEAARADDLPGAIAALGDARRLLVPARAVRTTAEEAGSDVSTIDDLLARLDTYDDALGRLYQLLVDSGGVVTDQIRDVYDEVGAAQASLPRNEDALRVVVSDLAGPPVTAALVGIETQRGLLADAVAARPDTGGG